jgi:hypothetical protein
VKSVELALPLARTVVEVPRQVQIARKRIRSAERPTSVLIKLLKENKKEMI